jgi:hypothetical protein
MSLTRAGDTPISREAVDADAERRKELFAQDLAGVDGF